MKGVLPTAVLCAVTAIACAGGVQAGTLSPASYNVYLQGYGLDYQMYYTPGTYSHDGGTGTVSPYPSVILDANVSGNYITVQTSMSYNFEVFGPDSASYIPLLIQTTLSTSASGDPQTQSAYALAQISVDGYIGATKQVTCQIIYGGGGCTNPSFSGPLSVLVAPNSSYGVFLVVTAQTQGGGSAHAFADPVISVDPGFAGASDYTVLLSDGVSNTADSTSAPEPSSLSLIGLAMGGAFVLRRRLSPLQKWARTVR